MRKFTRHGILTVCLLFLSIPLAICQQQSKTQAPVMSNGKSPFEGEWEWEKNDLNNNFVLKIVKEGNYLKGTYCSVMQKGAKVDCLQKDGTSFAAPVPGSTSFIAHFKSAYTPINLCEQGQKKPGSPG